MVAAAAVEDTDDKVIDKVEGFEMDGLHDKVMMDKKDLAELDLELVEVDLGDFAGFGWRKVLHFDLNVKLFLLYFRVLLGIRRRLRQLPQFFGGRL